MTDASVRSRAKLVAAEPQLFVADVRASCAFFEKLGFEIAFVDGEPPFYGQVKRDGARINLRCVDQPVIEGNRRDRETLLSAAVTVATLQEIEALHREVRDAGAPVHQPLKREPWGAMTFIIKDPDGNLLLFAGPAE
jgi:predicted lactoylglutathione lyase